MSHVEASFGGCYLPDLDLPDFKNKDMVPRSGVSGISSHASTVARFAYGSVLSVAPGVNKVYLYEANHWLGSDALNLGSSSPPLYESQRVQNHSWIGTLGSEAIDIEILRRLDLLIDRDGVVVAVAVNNGQTAMPRLLASAYNLLAVGLTNGPSSHGPTLLDGPGRVKPDIAVPASLTSWAAPYVSASAALLLDAMDANPGLNHLGRTEKTLLTKAVLMAGARKDNCPDWRRGLAAPTADGTVPLDYRYGSGELNIDNSHRILAAGQQVPRLNALLALTGWNVAHTIADERHFYYVEIPPEPGPVNVSILVTWNRRIVLSAPAGGEPVLGGVLDALLVGNPGVLAWLISTTPAVVTPSMANIDLHLYTVRGPAPATLVDQSVSRVDNVEHVFVRGLIPGRYAFEVASDTDWDYAIAWDMTRSVLASGD